MRKCPENGLIGSLLLTGRYRRLDDVTNSITFDGYQCLASSNAIPVWRSTWNESSSDWEVFTPEGSGEHEGLTALSIIGMSCMQNIKIWMAVLQFLCYDWAQRGNLLDQCALKLTWLVTDDESHGCRPIHFELTSSFKGTSRPQGYAFIACVGDRHWALLRLRRRIWGRRLPLSKHWRDTARTDRRESWKQDTESASVEQQE